MNDDTIASITVTATYNQLSIIKQDDEKVKVVGLYQGSTTTYRTDLHRIRIGGLPIGYLEHSMSLHNPDEQSYLYVEATEDELRITENEP